MTETMDEFLAGIKHRLASDEHHTAVRLAKQAKHKLVSIYTADGTGLQTPDPFAAGEITDEWIDATIERRAQDNLRAQRRGVLLSFIADAENRAAVTAADTDSILAAYHGRLTELLSAAKEIVDQLDGAATPTEAIDKGVTLQWKALTALADDYQALRAAQMSQIPTEIAVSARPAAGGEDHASDCYLQNLDTVWPTWRQPHKTPTTTYINGGEKDRNRFEPWPSERRPVSLLVWLITSRAEPWIPTTAQLRALQAQRARVLNPTPDRARPTSVYPTTAFGAQAIGNQARTATRIKAAPNS